MPFRRGDANSARGLKWSSPLIGPSRPIRTCRADPQFRLLTRYTLPPFLLLLYLGPTGLLFMHCWNGGRMRGS